MNRDDIAHPGRAVSDAGAFIERATHAAHPSNSSLARLGAAVSAIRLAARLLPAGRRLLRRNPVAGTLLIIGIAGGLYLARAARETDRI